MTILNGHLSPGTKDQNVSRLVNEPLFTANIGGTILPVLAAEVPTQANGGISPDGKVITIKLLPNVVWSDGEPFTANDVVFTWKWASDPATAAITYGQYELVQSIEAVDAHTARVTYKAPSPSWFGPFLGVNTILPKHALQDYIGVKAKTAPFNQKPIGTGPYIVESFTPGDQVIFKMNSKYRDPNKPAFDTVQVKGGGDPTSAARAIFQTGEYHFAWNLQVEWPVLQQIIQGGKGDLVTAPGQGVEMLFFNLSDPNKEVGGQKSHFGTPNPVLSDPKVRQAIAMAVDRGAMAKNLYGETGNPTVDVLTVPTSMKSTDVQIPFDIAAGNKLLDEAGWTKGSDGIREKNGVKAKLVYQTSTLSLRQKEQEIVKAGCQQLGIDLQLKSVDAGVFFGSAPGNTNTISHFYADMQTYTSTPANPAPLTYMLKWASINPSRDIAQKENQWSGLNYSRWENAEFNKLYEEASTTFDLQKFSDLMKQMNDLVVKNYVTVGMIDRLQADAKAKWLQGPDIGVFDSDLWNIADWTKRG